MATEDADPMQALREEVHQRYTGLENALMGQMDAIRLALERQDEQQKKQEEQQNNMIATMESLQMTAGVVRGMVRERVQGFEGRSQGEGGVPQEQGAQQQQQTGRERFYIGDQDLGRGDAAQDGERWGGNRRAEGSGGKRLDGKTVAHLKDNKFSGKEGGVSWANFFEDLCIAMGTVDKDLEEAVVKVTGLEKEKFQDTLGIKRVVGEDLWSRFSGELFARLMEITKEDAQGLVRNEGQKSARCGFWTLWQMKHRYSPKTCTKLLHMLQGVVSPREAKTAKDVQGAV